MAETEGSGVPERLLITRTTAEDGTCVVTLTGEVDLEGATQLRDVLLSCPQTSPATVVDFSDVTFMDSSGINALITAHHAAQARGSGLRLAAPRDAVRRVIQLVGVDTLIPCYASVQEALGG